MGVVDSRTVDRTNQTVDRTTLHRIWKAILVGVALGVATTRPIVGAFFAVGKLAPHEFFGTAFWLGFTLTLLGTEAWIRYSQRLLRSDPNFAGGLI